MQENLDRVDRYLEGNLSEQERAAFEEKLLHDQILQEQVAEMKLIRAGIKHVSRKAALQKFKALEQTLPPVSQSRLNLWYSTWLQAAAILLIGLLAYIFWPISVDEQELFATHFEAYPNIIMPTVRGKVTNDSTIKALAFRAYDQKQYEDAAVLFNRIENKDVNILFYLGNCYLALEQPNKALPLLENVLNNYDVFDEQAEWYLAICFLKLEERERATQALRRVVTRNSAYKDKAQTILDKLN